MNLEKWKIMSIYAITKLTLLVFKLIKNIYNLRGMVNKYSVTCNNKEGKDWQLINDQIHFSCFLLSVN